MRKTLLHTFDAFVDRIIGRTGYRILAPFVLYVGSMIMLLLMGLCFAFLFMNYPSLKTRLVRRDMQRIVRALYQVDRYCHIETVTPGLHPLNFLTLPRPTERDFCGIELEFPKQWTGPYFSEVPVLDNTPYQLLKTEKGLFLVPGNGVRLPNGNVIGIDIVWHYTTEVAALAQQGGALWYDGIPLARHIPYGHYIKPRNPEEKIRRLNASLKEFASALSFACNGG